MQEPKSDKTISIKDKNGTNKERLDLSASTCKRRRSPHSSQKPQISNSQAKGDSEKVPTNKQGFRSRVNNENLRMLVLSKLDQCKNNDGKYNAIIRILADAGFLQFCYMLIKGKLGNMSAGYTKETLDGLTYE